MTTNPQVATLRAAKELGHDASFLLWATARKMRGLHRKYDAADLADTCTTLCDAGYAVVARKLPELLAMPGEVFAAWEAVQGYREQSNHVGVDGIPYEGNQTARQLAALERDTLATIRPERNLTPAKRYAPENGTPRETLSQQAMGAWVKIRGRWAGVPTAPHGTPGPNHVVGRADDHTAIKREQWSKHDARIAALAADTASKQAKPYVPPRKPGKQGTKRRGKGSKWSNVPR